MFIIKYKKIFFALAIILVGGSLGAIIGKGFNWGVDFTGGSVLEMVYENRPSLDQIKQSVYAIHPDAKVQEIGTNGIIIRTAVIDQDQKDVLVQAVSTSDAVGQEKRFNTIGPSIGKELRSKALTAIIIVSLAIILFIAFAFRTVSKPISSWVYGIIAIAVLIHDVVIPAGFFALTGMPVDALFVVGILTILGVSINDTIVVFDRIRENLHTNATKNIQESFEYVVGKSINQTFVRSLMTSVTVLVALGALYIWGPATTKTLAIAMFLGMLFGTYSSIFLASPLLVVWNNWKTKK